MSRSSGRRTSVRIAAIFVAALAIGLVFAARQAATPAAAPHFWQDTTFRSLRITADGAAIVSEGPVLTAELVSGSLPADARQATVLSDENCVPDVSGISHCLNELQIGAQQITVRHNHNMHIVPCLTPGESVNIITDSAS